jgi:hypothetical protein
VADRVGCHGISVFALKLPSSTPENTLHHQGHHFEFERWRQGDSTRDVILIRNNIVLFLRSPVGGWVRLLVDKASS